jgi:hypothetical protein
MYTLAIQSPIFDNRDCIRGTRTTILREFGAFETLAWAFRKADRLHDEWKLDLGDGDNVQVWQDGKRVQRPRAEWAKDDDFELPF